MKVVYITGSARCGSTLIGNILGELPGAASLGEVRFLWKRVLQGRSCGCGKPVASCEVWSEALARTTYARGTDLEDVVSWDRRSMRFHRTPALLLARPRSGAGDRSSDYLRLMEALYGTLADVTGARILVDSSKRPTNAAVLRWMPTVDAYVLHVVRDPRAVVHSRRRGKRGVGGRDTELRQRSVADGISHWSATNAGGALVRRAFAERGLLVHYESFVAHPRRTLEAILDLIGEPGAPIPLVDEHTARLGPNHTVSGNPDRFQRGDVTIREDDRWLSEMPLHERRLVTAGTFPMLLAYRYPISVRATT